MGQNDINIYNFTSSVNRTVAFKFHILILLAFHELFDFRKPIFWLNIYFSAIFLTSNPLYMIVNRKD